MTAIAWCPALRPGIIYRPGEGGAAQLWDPILRREVDLGRMASAIVERLDGRRPVAEVLGEAAEAIGAGREAAEASLRTLLLMNLIEGSGEDIVERARRVREGEHPGVQILPETQFACQGSGDCCQSYSYGPLPPGDRARLEALPLREAFPQLGDGPLYEEREAPNGDVHYYLRSAADRCVFLQADCRCGIHARFGADAKPAFCSDFPLHFTPTLDGLRIYDRGECSMYSVSAVSGPPLAADPGRLLRLMSADHDLAEELDHPVVLFDRQTPCDFGHFLRLQDALCAGIARSDSAAAALRGMGRLMERFRRALGAFPLAAGEPDRTLGALCGAADVPAEPDAATLARGLETIVFLAGELLREAGFRIAAADHLAPPLTSERNVRQFATVIHAVRLLAADRAGLMDYPLPDPYQRIAAVDATDPALGALILRSLRQQAFGARMLLDGRPVAALLRVAFAFLVTIVGARGSAAASARTRTVPADFDQGHLLAMRVLRMKGATALFIEHEERAFDVIAAAPILGEATAARGP